MNSTSEIGYFAKFLQISPWILCNVPFLTIYRTINYSKDIKIGYFNPRAPIPQIPHEIPKIIA
jgi:hypothetical protein